MTYDLKERKEGKKEEGRTDLIAVFGVLVVDS